jgi:hypothetical protein
MVSFQLLLVGISHHGTDVFDLLLFNFDIVFLNLADLPLKKLRMDPHVLSYLFIYLLLLPLGKCLVHV